ISRRGALWRSAGQISGSSRSTRRTARWIWPTWRARSPAIPVWSVILRAKITGHTRLVAAGYASNAVGTINNVREMVRLAHEAGAMAFIDAVHYAPHGPMDVRELDCDFLVCSTYKFFGPHMGVLYGKREHLKRLYPYKVRANTDSIPNRWEWGTLNHECIAGI